MIATLTSEQSARSLLPSTASQKANTVAIVDALKAATPEMLELLLKGISRQSFNVRGAIRNLASKTKMLAARLRTFNPARFRALVHRGLFIQPLVFGAIHRWDVGAGFLSLLLLTTYIVTVVQLS